MTVHNNSGDLELIDQYLGGDQSACRMLIDRHKTYAFTIAYRIIGNREDAQEIAQDAFVKALKSLVSFNRTSKFTTWFYRIVHNMSISHIRKANIRFDSIDNIPKEVESAGILENLNQQERKVYLEAALAELGPEDRSVLTLFYLKELSLDEMAEISSLETNTLKVRLFRARKRLGNILERILEKEVNSLL